MIDPQQTMTPAEYGAVKEEEADAEEAASLSAEQKAIEAEVGDPPMRPLVELVDWDECRQHMAAKYGGK